MSEEVDRLRNSNERFILENLSLGERINNLEKELKVYIIYIIYSIKLKN